MIRKCYLCIALLTTASLGQNFAVSNPKNLNFPVAEANRIYKCAAVTIQREFQQTEPVRPTFTLVLGVDRNQLDVATSQLRLVKWDTNLFAQGVVLFSFEQLMPEQRTARLVQRVLSQASAVVTPEEVRSSGYAPQMRTLWSPLSPLRPPAKDRPVVLHPN